jgi:hypothetical protein
VPTTDYAELHSHTNFDLDGASQPVSRRAASADSAVSPSGSPGSGIIVRFVTAAEAVGPSSRQVEIELLDPAVPIRSDSSSCSPVGRPARRRGSEPIGGGHGSRSVRMGSTQPGGRHARASTPIASPAARPSGVRQGGPAQARPARAHLVLLGPRRDRLPELAPARQPGEHSRTKPSALHADPPRRPRGEPRRASGCREEDRAAPVATGRGEAVAGRYARIFGAVAPASLRRRRRRGGGLRSSSAYSCPTTTGSSPRPRHSPTRSVSRSSSRTTFTMLGPTIASSGTSSRRSATGGRSTRSPISDDRTARRT